MTLSLLDQTKNQIMADVLYILDSIRKDRYFLNKHFQNSISNYFLEDYAGSFLKEHLNLPRAKEVTKYILAKTEEQIGTKYMKLMHGYIDELKEAGSLKQFQSLLQSNLFIECTVLDKQSKEWQSIVWKRAFSLFVLHASKEENRALKGIFEIWNSLFPNNRILRKRQENVSHRPDEFTETEINTDRNLTIKKIQPPTAEEKKIITSIDHQFFFGSQEGVFNPNDHMRQMNTKACYQLNHNSFDNEQKGDFLFPQPEQLGQQGYFQQAEFSSTDPIYSNLKKEEFDLPSLLQEDNQIIPPEIDELPDAIPLYPIYEPNYICQQVTFSEHHKLFSSNEESPEVSIFDERSEPVFDYYSNQFGIYQL